jgi:hypothetical protein
LLVVMIALGIAVLGGCLLVAHTPRPGRRSARPAAGSTSPVLNWKRVRLVSVVADDTCVLLACRRHPAALTSETSFDHTIVLHLGMGAEAWRAQQLLEQWCRDGAWLRVGLAPVEGLLELADRHWDAALWAPLAAA